jgi:glucose/arabinose dehydrogenase
MLIRLPLFIALVALAPHWGRAGIEVPPGFEVETLARGLNAATAIAPAPDGRIFIADQFGPLRVWKQGSVLETPALDLSARLDTYWERGLIGVTLHPQFPEQAYVYVMYVAKEPYTHHVISRFTLRGDIADPASERVLLKGDDQTRFKGSHPHGHQGGPLRFGPDGRLYAAIGEQTAGKPAQQLDALLGKILRIEADGTIPTDNPFVRETEGKYRSIYAIGLRNVFGLAFLPGTNRLFGTDVGQTSWEEVNEIMPGVNYGWPDVEGVGAAQGKINPRHVYPPAIGRSIVGATFATTHAGGGRAFPERWQRQLFFGDWAANWIKAMNPDSPYEVANFARNLNGPVAVEFAADNSMLVLERGTIWNDQKTFVPRAGSLVRIRYTGETVAAETAASLPARLSEAGVFRNFASGEPAVGFERFELTAPLWMPGVKTQRWIAVPASEAISVTQDGQLEFPAGTRIVQHFTTDAGVPFETHVYWFTDTKPRAGAYRWRDDRRDAALVKESALVPIPGSPAEQWHSPGAETQLDLAATVSGFVLQLTVAQLNRDVPTPAMPVFGGRAATGSTINQLLLWSRRGWLAKPLVAQDIAALPRMAALGNAEAPLELRVRSYLDGNCSMCHRPGGPSRAAFDARVERPLHEAGLLDAAPIAGDMGIAGARVVVPGSPDKSLLALRLRDSGPFRMPPIRLSDEPPPVLPALEEWIRSLKK